LRPSAPIDTTTAAMIDEPTVTGRAAGWSTDSTVLYLLLDTDGTRCLYGQRIDPLSGALVGTPFAVRHFHDTSKQGYSTSLNNAVTEAGFLYEVQVRSGTLWRTRLSATSR
jgi:hypothetical protein